MNLEETISLHEGEKYIELKKLNLLRLTMVYMQEMLPTFYEETKQEKISDFMKWLASKLDLKKGDAILH